MEYSFCQGLYGNIAEEFVEEPIYSDWCHAAGFPSSSCHYIVNSRARRQIDSSPEERMLWRTWEDKKNQQHDDDDDSTDSHNHQPCKILSRNPKTNTDVLTPAIMESFQPHFPLSKRGESFWLKYSLVRDGASIDLLLDKVKDMEYTVLAIETVDGEVFGCFSGVAWQFSRDWYGSGQNFLWRLPYHRPESFDSSLDEAGSQETDLEVFKFAFENHNLQLCEHDRIVVGGGNKQGDPRWGFGLCLDGDLLRGSSSPCLTFNSPALSTIHSDGSPFEVRNLEVWTLTPCISVEEAERNQRKLRLLSGAFFKRAFSFNKRRASSTRK